MQKFKLRLLYPQHEFHVFTIDLISLFERIKIHITADC